MIIFYIIVLLTISIINFCKEIFKKRSFKTPMDSKEKLNFLLSYMSLCLVLIIMGYILNKPSTLSDENDISERIRTISADLEKTSKELSTVQQLLEARVEYVENLKKEADIAENVISLSEEQVNAVQAKINQEINANSEKDIVTSFIINAIFFTLGLVVQAFIQSNSMKKNTNKQPLDLHNHSQEELLQLLNEAKDAIERNNSTFTNDK